MYKHILFATDFSPEAQKAEARALEAAQQNNAKLSVIHVIDYYPSSQLEGGLALLPDLEKQMSETAQNEMDACAARIPIELDATQIRRGPPKRVITECADEIKADLIVLGSHGRHGLGLLLGSTANGVLHLAKCDVLAVRVYE